MRPGTTHWCNLSATAYNLQNQCLKSGNLKMLQLAFWADSEGGILCSQEKNDIDLCVLCVITAKSFHIMICRIVFHVWSTFFVTFMSVVLTSYALCTFRARFHICCIQISYLMTLSFHRCRYFANTKSVKFRYCLILKYFKLCNGI